MIDEKRKHERFPLTQAIELTTDDGSVLSANGINISESGILFQTDAEIARDVKVVFQLQVPMGKSVITVGCEGVVVRCLSLSGKYHVAIKLTDQEFV